MMSDSFLYSDDDAGMIQCCRVAVRECSGISSDIEAGYQLGHQWHLLLNVV